MAEQPAPSPVQTPTGQLAIQKIYVKDLSFESPKTPEIFKGQWKPELNLEINTKSNSLDANLYEVVLGITVTVKNESKIAYLIEVQQAGIFLITGIEDKALAAVLGSLCPNILFPYVREAVSDVVTKGGFPQLLLAPINFDAIYADAVKRKAVQAQGREETPIVKH